jgi:hypothetical protein
MCATPPVDDVRTGPAACLAIASARPGGRCSCWACTSFSSAAAVGSSPQSPGVPGSASRTSRLACVREPACWRLLCGTTNAPHSTEWTKLNPMAAPYQLRDPFIPLTVSPPDSTTAGFGVCTFFSSWPPWGHDRRFFPWSRGVAARVACCATFGWARSRVGRAGQQLQRRWHTWTGVSTHLKNAKKPRADASRPAFVPDNLWDGAFSIFFSGSTHCAIASCDTAVMRI